MARVLIVEDEQTDRLALATIVEGRGHVVYFASNGEQAFKIYMRKSIDVVVTDLLMPHVSGIEFIVALKALFPDAPIIAVSAKGPELLATAENKGACAALGKPVDPQELLEAIEKAAPDSPIRSYSKSKLAYYRRPPRHGKRRKVSWRDRLGMRANRHWTDPRNAVRWTLWLEMEGGTPALAFGAEGDTDTFLVDCDDGLSDLSDEALQGFVDEAMRSLMNEMLESVEDATVKSDDSGDPDSGAPDAGDPHPDDPDALDPASGDPDSPASGPSDNPE